jgi:hypothetical protein
LSPFNFILCFTTSPADLCEYIAYIPAMADALPRVIRIPRSDLDNGQDHAVLVYVESAGKHSLDIKLVGTDGESVFSVSCKLAR